VIDARTARIVTVGIWSTFFWVVWLSGDAGRYLGERTLWVVPFGAFATALALAGLVLQRRSVDTPVHAREGLGMLVLLMPLLFVLAVPDADLGASAAERRVIAPETAARQVAHRGPITELNYAHIMAASAHPQPGVVPGVRVRLKGFAMRRQGTQAGLFQVGRFEINCCIADATALAVTVDPPAEIPADDQWIIVTGPLARRGGELIIEAEKIRLIDPPKRPYLWQGVEADVPSTRHGTRPPDPSVSTTPTVSP
jgi:uncharacterized repeat protein (TIGR03943 family)